MSRLLALCALSALCAAAASSSSASGDFYLLVVRSDCWNPYFKDFSWLSPSAWASGSHLRECVTASVSKSLGYGIIAGSCIVKLPQVLNIIAAGSGEGLSASSQYQELLSNVMAAVWHVWNGSPFSAFGECVIVSLGTALVIGTLWYYSSPGMLQVGLIGGLTAAMLQLVLVSPEAVAAALAPLAASLGQAALSAAAVKNALQLLGSLAFWGSRLTQIAATFAAASNGAQSPLTLVFNLAGTAARVFTSLKEVKDPLQLYVTVFNAFLNAVLVAQFLYYMKPSQKGSKRSAAAAAGTTPRRSTRVKQQ
jgi:hypothetical protein